MGTSISTAVGRPIVTRDLGRVDGFGVIGGLDAALDGAWVAKLAGDGDDDSGANAGHKGETATARVERFAPPWQKHDEADEAWNGDPGDQLPPV